MQLLYPAFLWALSSLLIPIAIHLFNLRRPTRTVFTNVAFLKEVKNTTNKSRNLKHLLVLFCRLVFLLFLVLLFAQPFLPAKTNQAALAQKVAIMVDNSFSMQSAAEGDEANLLDKALRETEQLAGVFPRNTDLLVTDNSFRTYQRGSSQQDLVNKINAIDFSGRLRPTSGYLSKAAQLAGNDGRNTQVFFLSDFRKSTFSPEAFAAVDSGMQMQLVHFPAEPTPNVFIDTVELADAFVRLNEMNSITAVVRNAGSEPANTNVKFFMGSQQVSSLDLELDAQSNREVEFSFKFPAAGNQLCRLVVEDFPITFDNEYFFVLGSSPDIRILNYTGNGTPAVDQVLSNEPVFKLTSANQAKINYADVAQADLVILNGISNPDAALADNLKRQVEAGSTLVFIPSSEADQAAYLQFLLSVGVRAASWTDKAEMQPLAVPDLQNPFFRNIFEQLPKDIETPKAQPLLSWSRASEDILKFRNGNPYLSAFKVGKGRVFVFASPLTPAFTDFTSNALFVPVMYKLAMRSQRGGQFSAYSFNQSAISLPVSAREGKEQIYKLVKDSVEWIPDQRIAGNQLIMTIPADLDEAGFYELRGPNQENRVLAFNYDERESELQQYTVEELTEALTGYRNVKVVQSTAGNGFARQYEEENKGQPLWKYCLLICLLALAAETAIIRFVK